MHTHVHMYECTVESLIEDFLRGEYCPVIHFIIIRAYVLCGLVDL